MNTASEFLGNNSIFAKKLKTLREERGISQKTLAAAISASRQAVAQYEDGIALPNIEKLYKIANYFKVSTDFLLGLANIPNPDINDRVIHNKLGLSEQTITLLSKQMQQLYKYTNSQTPKEAFEKFNKIQSDLTSSLTYRNFSSIAKERELNIDETDDDARIEAQLFVPFSYIFNKFAMDKSRSAVLGELYDLIMFLESDYIDFLPMKYGDFDDILAIHIVRLQRAFMYWVENFDKEDEE